MVTLAEAAPWLTWGVPIIGAILTPLTAKINEKVRDYSAVIFSFLAAVFATTLLFTYDIRAEPHIVSYPWITTLGINASLRIDPLSVFMANVVAWISFLIMVYSLGYMHGDPGLTRYWFFMNYFIGNMLLIVLSDSLLLMFIGWEGVGLCSYQLIGFWYSDEEEKWVGDIGHKAMGIDMAYSPSHAGMKAFIMTRLGDAGFLIGMLTLYYATGTFDISMIEKSLVEGGTEWLKLLGSLGILIPSLIAIIGGPVGKSAQFPLHEWLPDAMTGPTSVSALIHAATMVKAGVFFIARFSPIVFISMGLAMTYSQLRLFFEIVASIGAVTAFIAATQAMVSREVKKVLAYSTVSQIGYMMLGLGTMGLITNFALAYFSGLFHLMSHAIFKASLFLAAGALIHATETRYMDEMGGLKDDMKITFWAMLLAGLSLAGVPPFSGFWSKDLVILSSLESNMLLFMLGIITAGITAFYTIRMIGMIFFGEKSKYLKHIEEHHGAIQEAPAVMWIPYTALALASIVFGILAPLGFEKFLEKFLTAPLEVLAHKKLEISFMVAKEPTNNINEILTITSSIIMLIIGLWSAYVLYISRRVSSENLVRKWGLKVFQKFFYNRWYINPIYYKIFVNGTLALARNLFKLFETGIIDRFTNDIIPRGVIGSAFGLFKWFERAVIDKINDIIIWGGTSLSNLIRKVQRGFLQEYVWAFIMGLSLILLYLLIVGVI